MKIPHILFLLFSCPYFAYCKNNKKNLIFNLFSPQYSSLSFLGDRSSRQKLFLFNAPGLNPRPFLFLSPPPLSRLTPRLITILSRHFLFFLTTNFSSLSILTSPTLLCTIIRNTLSSPTFYSSPSHLPLISSLQRCLPLALSSS